MCNRIIFPQNDKLRVYERERHPFLACLEVSLAGLIQSEWEGQEASYQMQNAIVSFD